MSPRRQKTLLAMMGLIVLALIIQCVVIFWRLNRLAGTLKPAERAAAEAQEQR